MSDITLLIDNDVVIKLAQMDAYADGIASIGVDPNGVGSLGVMLKYMTRMAQTNRLSTEEADRLRAILLKITEVEPTSEESRLSAHLMKVIIQDELDMDEGEVALAAVALKRIGTIVATGDKRALRSLPSLEERYPELKTLRGRFVCLEQIFKRLCETRGLPRVRRAILIARHADQTLTQVYDFFEPKGAAAFLNGIQLVIQDRIAGPAPGWLRPL